jgi:hypothetical protein
MRQRMVSQKPPESQSKQLTFKHFAAQYARVRRKIIENDRL